jgi:hypothetical protein
VALDKHAGVQRHGQLVAQLSDAVGLVLAATVRQEDERNTLFLQEGQGFRGAGYGCGAAEEDAIDTVYEVMFRVPSISVSWQTYSKAKAKSGVFVW